MVSLHIRHSAIQTATWILAICMSEYSGVQIFNFPNLVCFFKESSAGQIKGLSGPDVARGPYFGDPCYNAIPFRGTLIEVAWDEAFFRYQLKVCSRICCSYGITLLVITL